MRDKRNNDTRKEEITSYERLTSLALKKSERSSPSDTFLENRVQSRKQGAKAVNFNAVFKMKYSFAKHYCSLSELFCAVTICGISCASML